MLSSREKVRMKWQLRIRKKLVRGSDLSRTRIKRKILLICSRSTLRQLFHSEARCSC